MLRWTWDVNLCVVSTVFFVVLFAFLFVSFVFFMGLNVVFCVFSFVSTVLHAASGGGRGNCRGKYICAPLQRELVVLPVVPLAGDSFLTSFLVGGRH